MKPFFVHRPLFRLISPFFSGAVVYLLILLINNSVTAVDELFLGQELYFCIGLAYLIQETARLSIHTASRLGWLSPTFSGILFPALGSSVLTIALVTVSMYLYFELVLGFTPIISELTVFNAIFIVITWMYLVLFITHDILQKSHTVQLQQEEALKSHVEQDFAEFKQGINPELLFESLEQLLILSRMNVDQAEVFLDELAVVYRYVLTKRQELVSVQAELEALQHFVKLVGDLPNRNVAVNQQVTSKFLMVPGVLIKLAEVMIRSAIIHPMNRILLDIAEQPKSIVVKASFMTRIETQQVAGPVFELLKKTYSLYTDEIPEQSLSPTHYEFVIPKLILAE